MRWGSWLLGAAALLFTVACNDMWMWDDMRGGEWEPWGGEFEAGAVDGPVRVDRLSYELQVSGQVVAGCFEISFAADTGENMTATYRFPLPAGAVVYSADIYLPAEERWERAVTLGRREGQAVFEEIVQPRPPLDPLLVQQIGPDVYRARAYPVGATQPLRSRICYTHLLERTATGAVVQVALLDPGDVVERVAQRLLVSIDVEGSGWVGQAWYGRDATTLPEGEQRDEVNLALFSMSEDLSYQLEEEAPVDQATALVYVPEDPLLDEHAHVAWTPDLSAFPGVEAQPRNVVFVIDVSGSMLGAKLAETQNAVVDALYDLDQEDSFGLVAFDTGVEVFREEMSSGDDVAQAVLWVLQLAAGSSTNISAGLAAGAAIGSSTPTQAEIDLLLVTDGRPTAGSQTAAEILDDVQRAANSTERDLRIFAFGIGNDLDQELLNQLAHETEGEASFALDDAEIADQFGELFDRVRGGGLFDVVVELEGGGLDGVEQFRWRRLFPGVALSLGATGHVSSALDLTLTATDPDGAPVAVQTTARPDRGDQLRHRLAAPLAASSWADRMARQMEETSEDPELIDGAVILAKRYNILTRYSSMLALETEEMYLEHGLVKLARDPAGIALEEVPASVEDEARIGGQGIENSGDAMPMAGDGAEVGCGCAAGSSDPASGSWLVLGALLGLLRLRRRR